ncbi:unnamed protein product [Bemisia tabaci]|uniref:F-box domain-containing protein n=1 Tax=Bemisia tabaci TaxID=7038 RepID=A0A9P0AP39_BEMTA|nr:unnamed protein product [Bemisia tabaci]
MNFYNLLFAIGACCFPTEQIQMFDELPVELVIQILSFLDPKSLSIMSRMNKRLFNICKNNKGLRTTIRRYLRKERKGQLKKMLNPVKVRVLRREAETTDVVFQRQNTRRETVVTRYFEPSQVSQGRREDPQVVFRRQNTRDGDIVTKKFGPSQVLPSMKRPIAAASKKRSRGGQEKNPGPGLAKRMRI